MEALAAEKAHVEAEAAVKAREVMSSEMEVKVKMELHGRTLKEAARRKILELEKQSEGMHPLEVAQLLYLEMANGMSPECRNIFNVRAGEVNERFETPFHYLTSALKAAKSLLSSKYAEIIEDSNVHQNLSDIPRVAIALVLIYTSNIPVYKMIALLEARTINILISAFLLFPKVDGNKLLFRGQSSQFLAFPYRPVVSLTTARHVAQRFGNNIFQFTSDSINQKKLNLETLNVNNCVVVVDLGVVALNPTEEEAVLLNMKCCDRATTTNAVEAEKARVNAQEAAEKARVETEAAEKARVDAGMKPQAGCEAKVGTLFDNTVTPGTLQIFVRSTESGINHTFKVNSCCTVMNLMTLIQAKTKIPMKHLLITYGPKQLELSRNLSDYDIQNESTLHSLLRLRGGMNKHAVVISIVIPDC